MMIKFKSNLVSGIFSIIIGSAVLLLIPSQISAEIVASKNSVSSSTLPTLIAILFIVCGVILLFQSLILKKDDVKEIAIKKELWVCIYMAVLVLYAILFKYGFIWTTSLLAVITLIFAKCKNKWFYPITIVVVFLLYFVFKTLLHVRLPGII